MKSSPVQLIVGLGNPGPEYVNTRHNAGEDFVRLLADQLATPLQPTPKYFGLSARVNVAGNDVRLLVPTTYMNRSGQSVAAIAQFFKIPTSAILVAHDELDLPPGTVRLKVGGGHGGHNGLRDIIAQQGNCADFARLRIGIGHPGSAKQVVNYVLQRAPQSERDTIEQASETTLKMIDDIVSGEWGKVMRTLHTR